MNHEERGFWYGLGAYTAWGLLPLYWKLLAGVPVLQVIPHRIVWSTALLVVYIGSRGQLSALREALSRPGVLATYAMAAALIAINWTVFIWAVSAGYVVDVSLGYFVNPLLSMLIGVIVLGETLRPWQWMAVALAAAGVLQLTIALGSFPSVSLVLAASFALYGFVKKRAPLGAVHGLAVETGLLAVPALFVLAWSEVHGDAAFLHDLDAGGHLSLLLVGAGAVTTAPLLMFASAARSIPLVWIGILQYVAPTLQLLIGVFVFGEPFSHERLAGFALVWAALVVFAVEAVIAHRSASVVPPPE
ncbi:MAG TPA: EamA family transporter RarD [Candidatus Binatia bacterium]|jgi:chloramphenicol-sensitive protein RarD